MAGAGSAAGAHHRGGARQDARCDGWCRCPHLNNPCCAAGACCAAGPCCARCGHACKSCSRGSCREGPGGGLGRRSSGGRCCGRMPAGASLGGSGHGSCLDCLPVHLPCQDGRQGCGDCGVAVAAQQVGDVSCAEVVEVQAQAPQAAGQGCCAAAAAAAWGTAAGAGFDCVSCCHLLLSRGLVTCGVGTCGGAVGEHAAARLTMHVR